MQDGLSPVEKVLGRLEKYSERRNGEFRTRCPAHSGTSADSLSIKGGDDGRALLYCHAGCEQQEIVEALDLGVVDLFADNGKPVAKKATNRAAKGDHQEETRIPADRDDPQDVITTDDLPDGDYYGFTSPAGEILYIQRHKGPYYRKVGEDLWKEGLKGYVEPVLYNLHELVEGVRAGKTVLHLEGCKDVETARERLAKFVPTTSGGAKTWKPEYRTHYVGASVMIIPDNDPEGYEYAEEVAQDLARVAKSVKIAQLPDLEDKGDLTDWLDAGHTLEELSAHLEEAPTYDPEEEAPWPDPRDLDPGLPPVAPFTADMLPPPLGEHVIDAARRMDNVAPDFIAASLIVGAGAVIGRRVAIRPKANDDWEVICNLWGANVGPPSSMKTPAQAVGIAPITRLSAEARKRFQDEAKTRELDTMESKLRLETLRGKLKEAIKEQNPAKITEIREELAALAEEKEPTEARFMTSDATIEKLAELLIENPNGLLNSRDELMGWLSTLDRGGHEADRAFFLEAWDGRNPYDVDRIGRGSLHVPALCLSILGGIQPGPLMNYVQDALSEGEKADGLLQRFQVLVWPDTRKYSRSDEAPVPGSRDAVYKVFKGLVGLGAKAFGADVETINAGEEDEVQVGLPYLRFTDDAQALYNEWRDEFEPRVRSGIYPAAVESHLIKYRSLFPGLALIFQAIEYVSTNGRKGRGAVGMKAAARAAVWCEYLASHAMRLYHPAIIAPTLAAQTLLDHIEAGDVAHKMKTRDIWRKGWQGLSTADDLARAVDVLEEHSWVRRVMVKAPGRGRPSEILHIHPTLRDRL
jgi:hypothetical protein